MDLDDHVHGGDGADSHGVDRGADLAGGFHGGLAGILGEVAEDEHSARARGRVPLGQVGQRGPDGRHLAVARELRGKVLAVEPRLASRGKLQGAGALRAVEQERLNAEVLAELLQEPAVVPFQQGLHALDAAALHGGLVGGFFGSSGFGCWSSAFRRQIPA